VKALSSEGNLEAIGVDKAECDEVKEGRHGRQWLNLVLSVGTTTLEMSLGNSPAGLAVDALGHKETLRRCGIGNNRAPPDP
jgi:hypothetical protein